MPLSIFGHSCPEMGSTSRAPKTFFRFSGILSPVAVLSWISIMTCRQFACFVLLIAGIWNATAQPATAQQSPTEYQVKAAYLFNFLKFVEWPGESPADSPGSWMICVVGENPFGDDLARVVSGKAIQGHKLLVKTLLHSEDLRLCHILFISASEAKRLPSILAALKGSGVLTVADMQHFTESGGMIQFVAEDDRIRFVINISATLRGSAENQLEIIVACASGNRNGRKRGELKCNGPVNFRCAAKSRW